MKNLIMFMSLAFIIQFAALGSNGIKESSPVAGESQDAPICLTDYGIPHLIEMGEDCYLECLTADQVCYDAQLDPNTGLAEIEINWPDGVERISIEEMPTKAFMPGSGNPCIKFQKK